MRNCYSSQCPYFTTAWPIYGQKSNQLSLHVSIALSKKKNVYNHYPIQIKNQC
jgi:hypothetical protein